MTIEYNDDVEYIDQYYQNIYDFEDPEDNENEKEQQKIIIWSLEYSKLYDSINDIIEYYRNIEPKFDCIDFSCLLYKRNNYSYNNSHDKDEFRKELRYYLIKLSEDIYFEIQNFYDKNCQSIYFYTEKYKVSKDIEYQDFKEITKLCNLTQKQIFFKLLNKVNNYYI